MMRIAIDLLWVKHNQVGGIESYVRNLLTGFIALPNEFHFILLVSQDNKDSFLEFTRDRRIEIKECPVISTKLLPTVIWENLKMDRMMSGLNVDFCFVPYYRCPILPVKNKYLTVVHDLNALHFPEYFSKPKYYWLKYYWKYSISNATKIVAISNFVRNDIVDKYKVESSKIDVIYNPIQKDCSLVDFDGLSRKYGIEEYQYYYIVSSLHKHKNLLTILRMMHVLLNKSNNCPKLVISGIKVGARTELMDFIEEMGLTECCVFTGFVSDEERNTLMKYSKIFLFPSVFEGFGMPPIEAKRLGAKVLTTKCAAIPEVTQNRLMYVDNPFDENEWADKVQKCEKEVQDVLSYVCYNPEVIALEYYQLFCNYCIV